MTQSSCLHSELWNFLHYKCVPPLACPSRSSLVFIKLSVASISKGKLSILSQSFPVWNFLFPVIFKILETNNSQIQGRD